MPKVNLATGERINQVHTPEQKAKTRITQMRVAVWCGIKGLSAGLEGGKARLIMFTLTFRGVMDWAPRSIRSFCRWLNTHGCTGYVWVAELQKRGAVHYHVLALWPRNDPWVKPSKENGGWVKGFTWVTDNVEWPFYLMKYVQKGTKDGRLISYPKGLRIYAVSRGAVRSMPSDVKDTYRAIHLPCWYRSAAEDTGDLHDSTRVPGGIKHKGLVCISPLGDRLPTAGIDVEMSMWYSFHADTDVSA